MRAMFTKQQVRLLVLVAAVGALAAVIYGQGTGWKLGAPAATLHTEYQTEEYWIVTEIVRDVTEMSAYARKKDAKPATARVELTRPFVYRVAAQGILASPIEVDLTSRVWDADAFATLAKAAIRPGPAPPNAAGPSRFNARLTNLTPLRLARANEEISAALANSMSDAGLHEAAALTVGAFAMRESARRFDDVRWSLNRMTAHLAMARARSGAASTIDGQIANAILLTLANHQAKAMAAIESIEAGPDAAAAGPWTRALRVRLTQQWDLIREPAKATLLEKFEYIRAKRIAARGERSVGDFDDLDVDPTTAADWIRILQASYYGVEEGSFFAQGVGLKLEQEEALAVSMTFARDRRDEKSPNLNARATRCISDGKPQVIPWGAWAEFSQRHLAMLVGTIDTYWRLRYGDKQLGEAAGREIRSALQDLTLFPLATTLRRTGAGNGDADLALINEAIAVATVAPERVTVPLWSWLEYAAHYEAVRQGMPARYKWFTPASPRMPYGGNSRATELGHPLSAAEYGALAQEAPYDFDVRVADLESRFGDNAPPAQIQASFSRRLPYDIRAINYAVPRFEYADAVPLLEYACSLSATHCVRLAWTFVNLNRPAEAVREFERAFADPTYDVVSFANNCSWLVDYYATHNNLDRALAIAARASDIGSQRGLVTMARLSERLERFDVADSLYRRVFERYEDASELLGFYYRAVVIRKQSAYESEWAALLPTLFPNGLQSVPSVIPVKPEHGIIITKDNRRVMKAGFQAGDVIVGLEGFHVENLKQYRAVNAFFTKEEMKLSLWRGSVFNATFHSLDRLMGIEFRTYPIQGWKEE